MNFGDRREQITVSTIAVSTDSEGVTTNTPETIATLPAAIKQVEMTIVRDDKAQGDQVVHYIASCSNDPRVKSDMDAEYRDKILTIVGIKRNEGKNTMTLYLSLRHEGE